MTKVRFLDQIPIGVFNTPPPNSAGYTGIYDNGTLVSSSVPFLNFSGSAVVEGFSVSGSNNGVTVYVPDAIVRIGDEISGGISGSVLFLGASGVLTQSPARLSYSDADGLTVNPSGTIVGGFTAGANIKGADPTFRITQGNYGFGYFASGDVGYFMQTTNNWAGVTSFGGLKMGIPYWAFGSAFVPEAIIHSKARVATDIVSIFQGTDSQSANLTEWQDVSGNILSRVDSSGNVVLGNNKYLKWRNNANNADVNVFLMDTNDDLQALGTWQFINGLKTDTLTNRSGAMTIGTTNAADVTLQTDGLARLTIDGSTGNVGIGTSTPGGVLETVSNADSFPGSYSNNLKLTASDFPTLYFNRTSDSRGYLFGVDNNGMNFSTVASGSPTSRMVINFSGNIGIGTDSPATTLHIKGGISGTIGTQIARLEGSLPELWFKDTSDNTGFSISKYGNQVYFVNTNSAGAHSNYTGMMQLSSGWWTIGGGSNPLARLYVYGNTLSGGTDFYVQSNHATSTVSIFKGTTVQLGNLTEWRNVNDTVVASVDASGNANFKGQVGVDQLYFNHSGAGAYILNSANGRLALYNNSASGFDLLQFGGTTSSFPSLKRSSAELQVRLADDSDYATFHAKTYSVNGTAGFTGSGAYTNFVIEGGLITSAS